MSGPAKTWTEKLSTGARGLLWALAFGEARGAEVDDARRRELETHRLVSVRPSLSGSKYGLRLTPEGWGAMRELRGEAL